MEVPLEEENKEKMNEICVESLDLEKENFSEMEIKVSDFKCQKIEQAHEEGEYIIKIDKKEEALWCNECIQEIFG